MAREVIFCGRKFDLARESSALPDGSTVEREVIVHPGAVVILPWVDDEHMILVRQYRFSVGETLWELPAGTLEPPETPEETARRELAEETGYRAGRWHRFAEYYPSPGILTERMFLFLAQDLAPGPMHLDAGEQLEPRIVAWRDALAWALDGTIHDGKTLVGLLLWEKLRSLEIER